jgi:hypothetical protein
MGDTRAASRGKTRNEEFAFEFLVFCESEETKPGKGQCQTAGQFNSHVEENKIHAIIALPQIMRSPKKLTDARQLFSEHHIQHSGSTNLRLH